MTLDELKEIRYVEIDQETKALISKGFSFNKSVFSMSLSAQINWSNLPNLPDKLFPLNISDINEDIYKLSLEDKMDFYNSSLSFKNEYLQSGSILKSEIKACKTEKEVNEIVDNRK